MGRDHDHGFNFYQSLLDEDGEPDYSRIKGDHEYNSHSAYGEYYDEDEDEDVDDIDDREMPVS